MRRSDGPIQPSGWKDLARLGYDYPEDVGGLSRRERRQVMRDWRREDNGQRRAWLRQQRQSEPASPAVVIVAVVLLAIIVLGFGGGLPRLLGRDDQAGPVGLLTPTAPAEQPTDGTVDQPEPSAAPTSTSSSVSVPPVMTDGPSAMATSIASHVTNEWAHAFYTRTPAKESYEQLVTRVGRYITSEVAESLIASGDPTYEVLRIDGGNSAVVAAPVTAPRTGSAPVDTPTRISRLVTIMITVTGKRPDRFTLPLLVTLIPLDGQWVISEINGGVGP
jgi:hypothetical protein